ncbi:nucleotidyltransferase family protein [Geothermobacter hydrogeniphilus]|uniref:Nucleotidyltransferase n=1 Tax=Geothermobacter hydrogeniphilus TaxID=1969733 RepID=A0A1X0YBQ2_9BACT|nr:nucleotidyltransferase family protein [Geothermobacter hydrogeniphilus]ORJ62523.1 nucleotidyltransferase [Geothermobacter hydrogeniphilus]
MDKQLDIQKTLSQHLDELKTTYGVERLGLFGSFSRGEQTPSSDIDLLVEFTHPVGFFQFLRLERELSTLLGRRVDLVTRKALKPHIGQRILAEVKYVQ